MPTEGESPVIAIMKMHTELGLNIVPEWDETKARSHIPKNLPASQSSEVVTTVVWKG